MVSCSCWQTTTLIAVVSALWSVGQIHHATGIYEKVEHRCNHICRNSSSIPEPKNTRMANNELSHSVTANMYQYYNLIQYNFIDLRRRNSLPVRLRDKDAGWKDSCFKNELVL